jgi:glucose-6-phosphate 1-dehydrogenase
MDAPSSLDGDELRDAKVEVLKAMPPVKKEDGQSRSLTTEHICPHAY